MTGQLTSLDVISERVKQMAEYVYNRLGPKVTDLHEKMLHTQDHCGMLDVHLQEVRDDVDKLAGTIFGNGTQGLKSDVQALQKDAEHQIIAAENRLAIIEQRLDSKIEDLQNWRKSLDRKVWAVLLVVISLLVETLYHTITRTP